MSRGRPAERGTGPEVHRRRSSLPNLKIMPLTMAERRLLARQKRQEEEERVKLEKQKQLEEKRERAKKLRQATRNKDSDHRRKCTILGSVVHCRYCGGMIDQFEFDDHKVSHPTQIRDRIWLGNAENAKDIEVMKQCGITHILNCTKEIDLPKNISQKIKSFKRIAIQDKNHETILDYIKECNAFFEEALSKSKSHVVLVHCREGRSRSVSFLSAYLMWKEKVSFHAVLSDITSKRHIVLPNNKFYGELERYDKAVVLDRKAGGGQFGKPDASFKLKKLKGNQQKRLRDGRAKDETPDSNASDEVKSEEDGSQGVVDGDVKLLRRRSSLSDLRSVQGELQKAVRVSVKIKTGKKKKGRKVVGPGGLSPVEGSPVGKKKRAKDGWADVMYEEKGKKKGKKKKKKKDGDLNVEEAMDVTDVFPAQNGDAKKKKKKKKAKK